MTQTKPKPKTAVRGHPFEATLNLETVVQYNLQNHNPGAMVLCRNGRRRHTQLVFAFKADGFHSYLDETTAETILTKLEQGLNALPFGESVTIHFAKFADDSTRQAELSDLVQQTENPVLKLALLSDKARVQQLTRNGTRQQQQITLYVTWTAASANNAYQGHLDKALGTLEQLMHRLQPDARDISVKEAEQLLRRGFMEGYHGWLNIFAGMGLQVRPLNADQLWHELWHRFCRSKPDPLPQKLVLDESGLGEHSHTYRHPTAILTKAALPKAHEAYVKLNDTYVGAVTMLDKPDGYADARDQLRFFFKVMKEGDVQDTDLFVQITKTDARRQRLSLQLANRHANTTMGRAEEQNATDVKAQVNAEDTITAQRALIQGATTLKVGCTALIQRKSRRDLDAACNRFISHVPGNAWMAREMHLAYQAFSQTLPVTLQPLLKYTPFDQRLIYLSHEVTGLMPLVKPRPHDTSGLELIAEDGGVPIHLNFCHPHPLLGRRNLDIFGTTRSGKSVLVGEILLRAITKGLPVITVDYPKPDGTSSFTDFALLLGGMYFDVAKECCNILEIPNLRLFSDDEKQQRLDQFKGSLIPVLMQLVIGEATNDQLPGGKDTLKALLQLALEEFFNDAAIMARYHAAHRSGPGSADWQRMPTLFDFLHFLREETLDLSGSGQQAAEARNYCLLKLRSFLHSPGVGKAISRPSTINADASLVVFALTNVTDPQDAAIMALTANIMALRRALAAPASIFFIDESPILMQFEQVSLMTGRIRANGAKAGVTSILAAQDPDTIAHSAAGAQILQNAPTRLMGRIQPAAITSFEQHLNIPRSVIADNASTGFFPNPQGLYSNWLLEDGGTYTRCRFYPSPILLALTANNPDEQAARTKVMRHFEGRPLEGLATFAKLLTQAIQSGHKLADVIAQWQETAV